MNMNKEKLKSNLLIFLFLSSVVLTFIKFNFIENFNLYEKNPYSYSLSLEAGLQSTLRPIQVVVRFGGNNNTKILSGRQRYYQQSKNLLKLSLSKAQGLVEVDAMAYEKAKQTKSLELSFTSLNGKLLSRSFFLEKSLIESLNDITQILIPLVDENAIYIVDSGKTYKLLTSNENSLAMVNELEKSSYIKYYSLKYLFGSSSEVLVPGNEFNILYKSYDTVSSMTPEKSDEIAKDIFNERYDFINRIVETDGSNIYTYNYGQQLLKIQTNGYIEYLNENLPSKDTDVSDAVLGAMNFLTKLDIDLKLVGYEEATPVKVKGKNGYKIVFTEVIDDLRLMPNASKYKLSLIVVGDTVHSFTGIRRSILPYDLSRNQSILLPFKVLDTQFSVLSSKFNVKNGVELFDKIDDIELLYFMDNQYMLIPSWQITIEGKEYVFNGYTGEILYYGLGQS